MQVNRKPRGAYVGSDATHGASIHTVKTAVTIVGVPSVYQDFVFCFGLVFNYPELCKTEWKDLASAEKKAEL